MGEYNGVIGQLKAVVDEHKRRLDQIEEQFSEDHDLLITLSSEVSQLRDVLTQHLEYHNKQSERQFTIRHGLLLAFVQFILYLVVTFISKLT